MTIREYYKDYKNTSKYGFTLPSRTDKTVAEFYDNCILPNALNRDNVLAWHEMLTEYAEREDAVFWIRYYESGNKKSGRWNNRRACITKFADGFSYVFVSNYDAHEIFNMVRLGVTPSADEFAEMMRNYEFPMHYDSGTSCEESDIAGFPKIGSTRGGILTPNHLYLAHINGIKSEFARSDGTSKALNKSEVERIFPRGKTSDWKNDGGRKTRTLNRTLSSEDKALVKAHFLRFLDPLNYYVVPCRDYESNTVCQSIGEHRNLNLYVAEQHASEYGKTAMEEFAKAARIAISNEVADPEEEIDISYSPIKKASSAHPAKTPKPRTSAGSAIPTIVFNPSDEVIFKRELLKCKKATVVWKYGDGTEVTTIWDARKLTAESNIRSNIQSKTKWRERNANGLIEVEVTV